MPNWSGLRPTSDRLRGTIFDVLADRSIEASVLDGCAGTGALGIEALSRGARHAVFIDRDVRAASLVSRNLKRCGIGAQATVLCGSLLGVTKLELVQNPYDLVLIDPPYDASEIGAILSSVAGVLAGNGILVLERSRRVASMVVAKLVITRSIVAGDSALDFYRLCSR